MNRKTRLLALILVSVFMILSTTGCTVLRAGPGRHPTGWGYRGIVNGYAAVDDLRSYDGDIIQVDIMSGYQQPGELINIDLWPIVGVGIGVVGVRAHIISLGAGIGFLFYEPRSEGDLPGDGEVHMDIE